VWFLSWRADPRVARLADRHYSRKTVGAAQFAPPGRILVLRTADADAAWVTSWPLPEYVLGAWPGAWVCSLFRNESPALSSALIVEAVAATRWRFGEVPAEGMVTFVDEDKVRPKRDPGRCFRRAGFVPAGRTTDRGLLILRLDPADMPPPAPPQGSQMPLAL